MLPNDLQQFQNFACLAAAARLDSVLPRRCGVCHLDKAPPAVSGLIVFASASRGEGPGESAMCYSCHNGLVRDDRRAFWTGRHHPASGRVQCGSCHTPHVRAANVGTFMRFEKGSYAFCGSCHPGRRTGSPGEHPAVAAEKGRAQDCSGCHQVHGAQGDGLIRAASAECLCGPCHGDTPGSAIWHKDTSSTVSQTRSTSATALSPASGGALGRLRPRPAHAG